MRISNAFSFMAAATLQFAHCQEHNMMTESSQLLLRGKQNSPAKPATKDIGRHLQTTPSVWDISFLGFTADFSVDSVDELVLEYSIGNNRVYNTDIFAKDCESPITDINITLVASMTSVTSDDFLTLAYSLDKSAIAGSNIWNNTSSKIELCQVVQLIIPAAGPRPMMVINEDTRRFDIDFDLSVQFFIDNDLGEATTGSEAASTNVTSYVESCKCGGPQDFTCNTDDLVPNTELFVCIKSISSDVEIDFLDNMYVTQGVTTLPVIEDNAVAFSLITSREYVAAENGVVVSTRVPTNLFNYTEGESISISGEIDMKLVGSSLGSRRLLADIDGATVDEDEIISSFELVVALQQEMVYEQDSSSNDSDNVIASRGLSILGMIFALAHIL